MKELLFEEYWISFWIWATISVTIIIALIVLIVFKNTLLVDKTNINNTRFIRIVIFSAISIFALFSITKFTLLYLDLNYVNSNDCEVFVGEFIGYTRYVESNEPGNPRGKNPLFKDNESNQEITLKGSIEYEIGETYSIYYLPHSMVYIVVKINDDN